MWYYSIKRSDPKEMVGNMWPMSQMIWPAPDFALTKLEHNIRLK